MAKRIYKYATGDEVPEGAIFLSTQTQEVWQMNGAITHTVTRLVWHYFLVEVTE